MKWVLETAPTKVRESIRQWNRQIGWGSLGLLLLVGLIESCPGAEVQSSANIDFYHQNGASCDLSVVSADPGIRTVPMASLKKSQQGAGLGAYYPSETDWKTSTLKLKVTREGRIHFRVVASIHKNAEGKLTSNGADYQSITVNGRELIPPDQSPLTAGIGKAGKNFFFNADDGETLEIKVIHRLCAKK